MLREQQDNSISIKRLVLGMVRTNSYIVSNKEGEALIIDPADEPDRIIEYIEHNNLKPAAILLTHGHFDHIMAAPAIRSRYGISIYAHEEERELMLDGYKNLSVPFGAGNISLRADEFFMERGYDSAGIPSYSSELEIGGFRIKAIHTPGHTRGSVSYLIERDLFCGDTLFRGTYGRTDFPGGSQRDIIDSIKTKLLTLGDDVAAYPGHDDITTIREEKAYY